MSTDNQPFIYVKPKHKKMNPIKFSKSTSPLSHSLTVVDYYDEVANEKPVNVFKEKVPSPNNYTNFKTKVKINCKEDLTHSFFVSGAFICSEGLYSCSFVTYLKQNTPTIINIIETT